MSKHLTNAFFGVVDYASYPFGMLLVAPLVLHRLGASEYGLWMIATAVISAGGIVASGFCDANTQRIAKLRSTGDLARIAHSVRSMLGITMLLGAAMAFAVWMAAPWVAPHMALAHVTPVSECRTCLRIAALAIFVRAVETVGVSTLRGFEQYRGTVQISASLRLVTLGTAALLVVLRHGTTSILIVTLMCLVLGVWMQFRQVRRYLGPLPLWPDFQTADTRLLLTLGFFVWLQALGGVVFSHLDRILLGVSAGALSVAPYSLCVQFAHPIFGLAASGLHFLFPYFSGCATTLSHSEFRRTVFRAFACNLVLVAAGAAIPLLAGHFLIRLWAGAAVARTAAGILPPIVLGAALMGLSVTGTYAMQSLGLFRTVAFISLASRTALLLLMLLLLHFYGLTGLAFLRVVYGAAALIVYLPLLTRLRVVRQPAQAQALPVQYRVQEGSNL